MQAVELYFAGIRIFSNIIDTTVLDSQKSPALLYDQPSTAIILNQSQFTYKGVFVDESSRLL